MNVSLTPELEEFISQQVDTGLYTSASEVMRSALRLLVEREMEKQARLTRMRELVREGIDSGGFEAWDAEGFLAHLKSRR